MPDGQQTSRCVGFLCLRGSPVTGTFCGGSAQLAISCKNCHMRSAGGEGWHRSSYSISTAASRARSTGERTTVFSRDTPFAPPSATAETTAGRGHLRGRRSRGPRARRACVTGGRRWRDAGWEPFAWGPGVVEKRSGGACADAPRQMSGTIVCRLLASLKL